jgi:hypothetical protein
MHKHNNNNNNNNNFNHDKHQQLLINHLGVTTCKLAQLVIISHSVLPASVINLRILLAQRKPLAHNQQQHNQQQHNQQQHNQQQHNHKAAQVAPLHQQQTQTQHKSQM